MAQMLKELDAVLSVTCDIAVHARDGRGNVESNGELDEIRKKTRDSFSSVGEAFQVTHVIED